MAAQAKVDEYSADASGDLLSTAGSLLGTFLGGRRNTSALARQSRQRATAGRRRDAAADKAATIEQDAAELEDALAADIAEIDDAWSTKAADITTVPVPLERTDVAVTDLALVWIPQD
jgi:hypothetical protein